jgi:hypothetical protein
LRSAFTITSVLLALAALLGACANSGTTARIEAPKAESSPRTETAHLTVQYDLIKSAGLDRAEREKRETRAVAGFTPACVKPYAGRLAKFLDGAAEIVRTSRSVEMMASLPAQVTVIDGDFDRCLAKFGVSGHSYVETSDGRQNRVPQYITQAAEPLLNAMDAGEPGAEERQRNGAQVLAALAAMAREGAQINQSGAQPDTERDGAVVSGRPPLPRPSL